MGEIGFLHGLSWEIVTNQSGVTVGCQQLECPQEHAWSYLQEGTSQ